MRELLVRYLMGELDSPEQRHLESLLRTSPELRAELAYLRTCLNAADDSQDDVTEPPRGLAERTTDLVNEYSGEPTESGRSIPNFGRGRVAAFASDVDPPTGNLRWNFADFVVAAGVCLAVSMLLLPALSDSREAVLRRGCQYNLKTWGELFAVNSYYNDGVFIPTRQAGNAYVAHFRNAELDDSRQLNQISQCPGKTKKSQANQPTYLSQASQTSSPKIASERMTLLGPYLVDDYVFDVGYVDAQGHHSRRNTHSPYVPLASDAPCLFVEGQLSLNHPGIIQIVFQDGHVKIARTCVLRGTYEDHLFENAQGRHEAGSNPYDIVLGRVQIMPITRIVEP